MERQYWGKTKVVNNYQLWLTWGKGPMELRLRPLRRVAVSHEVPQDTAKGPVELGFWTVSGDLASFAGISEGVQWGWFQEWGRKMKTRTNCYWNQWPLSGQHRQEKGANNKEQVPFPFVQLSSFPLEPFLRRT